MAGEQKPFKDEKTEQPSAKKMNKQKSEGNIFMSQELATAIVVFLAAWILKLFGFWLFNRLNLVMTTCIEFSSWYRPDPENIHNFITAILFQIATILGPVIGCLVIIGAFSTLVQTGWVVSWKKAHWKFDKLMKFNWNQLNPVDGKKIAELLINICKISLMTIVLYRTIKSSYENWIPLMDGPVINVWFFMCNLGFKVIMKVCVILFLLAIVDFLYRKKKYIDDLKMTKVEVKEERKQAEGNPKIKAALKRKRYELFKKMMMEAVPQADVIITNPTHFAVAIKYESESMEAPQVTAKGVGPLAKKIKELGIKHGIPIVENKPLAQVLFKTVEVGASIPVDLYQSVAEVLAYVYKERNRKAA